MIHTYLLDDNLTILHSPEIGKGYLSTLSLSEKINEIPTLRFAFNDATQLGGYIQPRRTKLRIEDDDSGEEYFEGRVYDYDSVVDNTRGGVKTYEAIDAMGYLQDSRAPDQVFSGTYLALYTLLINRHNTQVTADCRFVMGVCEIGLYKDYTDGGTGKEVALEVNTQATVKSNAQYISTSYGGSNLKMNDWLKGKKVTISGRQQISGVWWYYLTLNGPQGYVKASELVEAYATTGSPTPNNTGDNGGYPVGTSAKIKAGVTTYYASSTSTTAVNIPTAPLNYRTLSYIVGTYAPITDRYPIYYGNSAIGWVPKSNLDFGNKPLPSGNGGGSYVEPTEIIEADLSTEMTVWEAFEEYFFTDGRIERTKDDAGNNVINIREKKGNDNVSPISYMTNIIDIKEMFDATNIFTTLIPIGKPPRIEGQQQEEDITLDEMVSSQTLLDIFDVKVGRESFLNVTSKEDLRVKATEWLDKQVSQNIETTITVMDLYRLGDTSLTPYRLSDQVLAETSQYLLTNGIFQIVKIDRDFLTPWKSKITVGIEFSKLSDFFRKGGQL